MGFLFWICFWDFAEVKLCEFSKVVCSLLYPLHLRLQHSGHTINIRMRDWINLGELDKGETGIFE